MKINMMAIGQYTSVRPETQRINTEKLQKKAKGGTIDCQNIILWTPSF